MPDQRKPWSMSEALQKAGSIGPDKTAETVHNPDNWMASTLPIGGGSNMIGGIVKKAIPAMEEIAIPGTSGRPEDQMVQKIWRLLQQMEIKTK